MKKFNEKELDHLFRDSLTGSEAPVHFREEDWTAMEKLLDKKSGKKAVIFRLSYYLSGIAALLLLAFGLFFLDKNNEPVKLHRKKPDTNTIAATKDNGQAGKPGREHERTLPASAQGRGLKAASVQQREKTLSAPTQGRGLKAASAQHGKSLFPLSALHKGRYFSELSLSDTSRNPQISYNLANQLVITRQADTLSTVGVLAAANITDTVKKKLSTAPQQKKGLKPGRGGQPKFAMSVLGAPDLNGINSFSNGKAGTSISLQFSIRLARKLSITTGATYSVKPYQTEFSRYMSSFKPAVTPSIVAANCKVLDIPVNLNYQFYSKGVNSFSLGTGLSSYFMLNEKYRFDYDGSSGIPAFNLDISGQNQHIFGVLNVNATYQRKISNKLNAIVQPYIKLPLTGIGNGQVNLKTTGVALGFSWNINPFGKPK